MLTFDPAAYGPAWAEILSADRNRSLGQGALDAALRQRLAAVSTEQLFAPLKITDEPMAELCLAAAWLLADDLDASHTISQQIETPSGSFWHGIMHRREGDFSNSKYWFRRVGAHPVYEPLGQAAQQLATVANECSTRETILAAGDWDPYVFVDLCAASTGNRARNGADAQLCRQIAQAEWELLFDACYRAAVS